MFCRPLSCQRDALCNALCFQRCECTVVRCLLGNKRHFWEQLSRWMETALDLFFLPWNTRTMCPFRSISLFVFNVCRSLRRRCQWHFLFRPKLPHDKWVKRSGLNPPVAWKKAPCLLWPLLVLEIATCLRRYNQISVSKSVTSEDSHYISSRFDLVLQQPTGSSENESLSPFPDKLRNLVGHFSPTFSGSRALTPRWEAAAATEVDGGWWSWRFDDWLESETHTHTLMTKWQMTSHITCFSSGFWMDFQCGKFGSKRIIWCDAWIYLA